MRLVLLALASLSLPDREQVIRSEIPADAVRYESAKNTQSIFRLDERRVIRAVPRTELEEKWQVPGGLVGVKGWRSDLYFRAVAGGEQYKAFIPVQNGLGYFQNEVGYVRRYDDGTEFYDVLSNTKSGKVFEVRLREKVQGVWAFRVPYRNEDVRPAGYKGVTRCNSCHSQAGTGSYGTGLMPGGDGTISQPLWDLK